MPHPLKKRTQVAAVKLLRCAIQQHTAFAAAFNIHALKVTLWVRFGKGNLNVLFQGAQIGMMFSKLLC